MFTLTELKAIKHCTTRQRPTDADRIIAQTAVDRELADAVSIKEECQKPVGSGRRYFPCNQPKGHTGECK